MELIKELTRNEMRNIMAGGTATGEDEYWVKCCGCQNDTCQGWVDDCTTGVLQICGPGPTWQDGPCATCTGTNPAVN